MQVSRWLPVCVCRVCVCCHYHRCPPAFIHSTEFHTHILRKTHIFIAIRSRCRCVAAKAKTLHNILFIVFWLVVCVGDVSFVSCTISATGMGNGVHRVRFFTGIHVYVTVLLVDDDVKTATTMLSPPPQPPPPPPPSSPNPRQLIITIILCCRQHCLMRLRLRRRRWFHLASAHFSFPFPVTKNIEWW